MLAAPGTPKSGKEYERFIENLNINYNLDLPIRDVHTPSQHSRSLPEKCVRQIKFLHYKSDTLPAIMNNFEEKVKARMSEWEFKPNQERGTLPSRPAATSFLRSETLRRSRHLSLDQRDELLEDLLTLLHDEEWMVKNRFPNTPTKNPSRFTPRTPAASEKRLTKRKSSENHEVFFTAPNSPNFEPVTVSNSPANVDSGPIYTSPGYDGCDDFDLELDAAAVTDSYYDEDQDSPFAPRGKRQLKINDCWPANDNSSLNVSFASTVAGTPPRQSTILEYMKVGKKTDTNLGRLKPPVFTKPQDTSFNTTVTDISNCFSLKSDNTAATSFSTCANDGSFDNIERASQNSGSMLYSTDQLQDLLVSQSSDKSEKRVHEIIHELETLGPFSEKGSFPRTVPLRYVYEAERVSRVREVPPNSIISNTALSKCNSSQDYEEFWSSINNQNGRSTIIERTKPSIWDAAVDKFEAKGEDKAVVTLSGELNWSKEPGFMKLKLNPLKFERSHRFARRFGSDRFLEITFPSLSRFKKSLPKHEKDQTVFKRAFEKWICTTRHHILGRIWRGFFVEDVKKKGSNGFRCKAFLFAVDGYDFVQTPFPALASVDQSSNRHTPMTVDSLINWHMPFEQNKDQLDCKLFNRISLGLSRTFATVTLHPEEILEVKKPEGRDMSDGCALMSRSLAQQISHELKLDSVVSCFQGRIAGAKGVWMIARDDTEHRAGGRDFWIEIKISQLKIYPHPANRKVALDEHQLTFEAVSWCRPLHPVNLNTQFLMVLQNGGLHKQYLRDLVQEEVRKFYQEFEGIFTSNDRVACRQWIQKKGVGVSGNKSRTIKQLDQYPPETIEQILLLLDAGFLPNQLSFLQELFKKALTDFYEAFENLKIRIPQSTYAYCVADPYDVLKEDEVHLGFSKAWEDSEYTELDGVDVLVARNPAHLPSDIQRRKAVYKRELRHLKNVIVFPVKGGVPLAACLSGGDYDGDESWVCWDSRIVDCFQNTSFHPNDIPEAESFGLINRSKSRANVSFDTFLVKAFQFNLQPNYLGMCTNEHERLCYLREKGIGDETAIQMSYLLSHLADTRKSGFELTRAAWEEFRNSLGLKGELEEPAYKSSEPNRNSFRNPENINIIDYLKFEVVRNEKDRALEAFDKARKGRRRLEPDRDLTAAFDDAWERASQEAGNEVNGSRKNKGKLVAPVDRTLLETLHRIGDEVAAARDKWIGAPKISYDSHIALASDLLFSIQPPVFPHPLSNTWVNAADVWKRLLASCAYRQQREGKFAWYAAGFTLCDIKADATGPHRVVMSEIHHSMRVKARAAKQPDKKLQTDEDEDSDESSDDIYLNSRNFKDLDLD